MKTELISFSSPIPSLFQIASFFEDFFPAGGLQRSASSLRHLPFAELMLNPDALMKLLKSRTTEVCTAEARQSQSPPKPTNRSGPSKKSGNQRTDKTEGPSSGTPKKVEFIFRSPSAKSVELVGDFTDWENKPVEMMHSQDGFWFTVVPLGPGSYSYRFIVDGSWCNDPASFQCVPNPFGTQNAVVHVT
jgi:hypothetical protein